MEDLGRETLQDRLPGMSPEAASRIYCRLLDITLHLHREGLSAARRSRLRLMPGFGPDLYRWEHGYFIRHILQDRLHAAGKTIAAVAADLQKTARRLAASPTALIHRDWQSSNVLFRGCQPVMIDFQGMRRGPAAYDLASLLCDPYADLPADLQTRLLRRYAGRLSCGHAVAAAFPAAAVQRLCQALGAYANLSRNPGMETFAGHIPAAARQLLRALDVFSCPALRRVACRLAGS